MKCGPAYLSLVIPVFNEEKIVGGTLAEAADFLKDRYPDWEIIVSDDGSYDRTLDRAQNWAQEHPEIALTLVRSPHQGKGSAVRAGMKMARGRYIFFSDADLSTPLEELPGMLARLEKGVDCIIGSRALPRSKLIKRQPFYRSGAGKIFNCLLRLILPLNIKDTQCGFKGFTAEAALKIFSQQKINGFAFDVEVLLLARQMGFKIEEVPVQWSNRPPTRLKLGRDSAGMLLDLVRLKWGSSVK